MPLLDNGMGVITQEPMRGISVAPVVNAMGGDGVSALPSRNWYWLRQPYPDRRGRACVSIHDLRGGYTRNDSRGGEPKPLRRAYLINDLMSMGMPLPLLANAATLRVDEWRRIDAAVLPPFRQKLMVADDILRASSYGGFNAMGVMTVEYQAMGEAGEAVVDMDARTDGRNDTLLFNLRSTPLPITHCDFGYSGREIMVSRNKGTPLDVAMGEMGGRRVGESIEDQTLGNVTGVTYGTQTAGTSAHTGTSTVYGLRNFPQRLTKSNFTAPTAGGWVPETTFNELLAALQQLLTTNYTSGPFRLYFSVDWFQYLNRNFSVAGGNNAGETLLTMIQKIPSIQGVSVAERLTATFTILIVAMNSDTVQMIDGLDITTVQWPEKGGLELRFKVMAIRVPRFKSDYNGRTGVLHGTTA